MNIHKVLQETKKKLITEETGNGAEKCSAVVLQPVWGWLH